MSGGKFANGARTAGFQYLFNEAASSLAQRSPGEQFAEDYRHLRSEEKSNWELIGMVDGYGRSVSVTTGAGQIRVIAFDTAASPHVRQFSYEFTRTPVDLQEVSLIPIHEAYATTGVYGLIGTQATYLGGGGNKRWRWRFKINNIASNGCGNCGRPALNIYEHKP